jgi:hypothetical protein
MQQQQDEAARVLLWIKLSLHRTDTIQSTSRVNAAAGYDTSKCRQQRSSRVLLRVKLSLQSP